MKKKTIIISILVILFLPMVLIMGCQKTQEIPPDTFETTYYLAEHGRSIVISGDSDGMPGEKSEYLLKINNSAERWQDEYYVLLVDHDSVIREISHERFDIVSSGGIQQPIMVEFPDGFKGALGLCVIIPQRTRIIATLSIGVKDAISTGWPDLSLYTSYSISGYPLAAGYTSSLDRVPFR
jgi:hypothetical protein